MTAATAVETPITIHAVTHTIAHMQLVHAMTTTVEDDTTEDIAIIQVRDALPVLRVHAADAVSYKHAACE